MMEEPPTAPTPCTTAPSTFVTFPIPVNPQPTPSPSTASHEKEKERKGSRKGLTKAVLSAHTQQEEQTFLNRFRDISQLRMVQPSSQPKRKHLSTPGKTGNIIQYQQYRDISMAEINSSLSSLFCLCHLGVNISQNYPSGSSSRRHGRGGKRRKHQIDGNLPDSSALPGSCPYRASRPPIASDQQSSNSWPPSVGSQGGSAPVVTPFLPGYMPVYPISSPLHVPQMGSDPSMQAGVHRFPMQGSHMFPPVMPQVMTFMLPNYMFPQMGNPGTHLNTQLNGQMNPLGQFATSIGQLNPGAPFNPAVGQFNPLGSQVNPSMPAVIPQQFYNPNPLFTFPSPMPAANATATVPGQSRSSTPHSGGHQAGEREGAGSPLFQSRCSSPLNLLQLEEFPSNRTDVTHQTPPPVGGASAQGGGTGAQNSSNRGSTTKGKLNDSVSSIL